MIISFSNKFIFFRPKKVGSTTIEFFLSNHLKFPDIWIKDKIEDDYFYKKHKIKSNYEHYSGKKRFSFTKIITNIFILIKFIFGKKKPFESLFVSKYDNLNTHSNFKDLSKIYNKEYLKDFVIISVMRDPFEQIISYAYHKAWQKKINLNNRNEINIINQIIIDNHKKFFSENEKYLNYPTKTKKFFLKLENLEKDIDKLSEILNIKLKVFKRLKLRSQLRNKKFNKRNLTKNTLKKLNQNNNFKKIIKLGNY